MTTDNNKYIPTPAEKKLLEVLINPEHYQKNITEICSIAEVDRTVYYNAMKKADFIDFYNRMMRELLKGKAQEVIKATYTFAVSNPKNHQDRKLLLEMIGEYTPKQEIEQNLNIVIDGEVKEWAK
jgi:flagellar motor component MotA